ncbi:MAG TPA: hypothetical protein VGI75_01985, partial [Pirellulales bacterium]
DSKFMGGEIAMKLLHQFCAKFSARARITKNNHCRTKTLTQLSPLTMHKDVDRRLSSNPALDKLSPFVHQFKNPDKMTKTRGPILQLTQPFFIRYT